MTDVSELGRFWLPDDPENVVEGTFIVDDNGATLVTQGQLLVSGLWNREPRTIHGVLATDHVKLVDALVTQSGTSFGRFLPERNQETWYRSGAFRGGQYDGDWPDNIASVEFQVQSLEDWVQGFAGLKGESGNSAGSVSWLRDPPDLTHQWELGEVSIRQTVGDSWQAARHHVREVTVRTNTFFHIDFDRPQSWEATLGVVGSLQALVSIATGKPDLKIYDRLLTVSLVAAGGVRIKLPTVGAQSVTRFTAAGHGDALATFLEVLEQEAEDRRHRRINRLRRESRLPSGKTWGNPRLHGGRLFEHDRMPLALRQQLDHLPRAASSSAASTCWPSDCLAAARPMPGAPWATAWWKPATPSSSLRPTVWCRNCWPPSAT